MGVIERVKRFERDEGLEKGCLEERARAEAEKRDIARKFKKRGVPVEEIAEDLGLSIEEVEKL